MLTLFVLQTVLNADKRRIQGPKGFKSATQVSSSKAMAEGGDPDRIVRAPQEENSEPAPDSTPDNLWDGYNDEVDDEIDESETPAVKTESTIPNAGERS